MNAADLAPAVDWIRAGGLVAYPTETVWGLGADAVREEAVARLRRWKGRAETAPLSILVDGADALVPLGLELGGAGRLLAGAFWPGPLTLVIGGPGRIAPGVARADGAVGVRCSPHPVAAALARALRTAGAGPVTATSLNRSGEAPATRRAEAEHLCRGGDDAPRLVPPGGPDAGGEAVSTVVDCTGREPRVLRSGALGEAALREVLRAA